MIRMLVCLLIAISSSYCSSSLDAADRTADKYRKVLAGSDSAAKKKALSALASGGEDSVRMPILIAAANDRQVGKEALKALQRRTGLKPSARYGSNPGYPGHPATDSAGAWSTWWSKKQAEEAKKKELEELAKKTEEAEKKAQAALDGDEVTDEDADADEDTIGDNIEIVTKKEIPAHVQYGKLDRIIFKSGNLLMCYIVSRQIDLDGKLTSIDIVHRGGAGEESISAALIASVDEDIR